MLLFLPQYRFLWAEEEPVPDNILKTPWLAHLTAVHNVVLTLALCNLELGFGVDSPLEQRDEEEHGSGEEDHDSGEVEPDVIVSHQVVQST